MFAVVFRILLRAAFTLLLLTACVFFGLHMTGDPARIMLGNAADEVALEAFRAQWGLNLPLWQQFLVYLEKFVSLDMGTSYMTGQPVRDVFLDALGPTLSLMIPTAVVTLLIGIPSGVCAALHRNTLLDRSLMVMSVFGYAVPNFFMGVLLLLVFSIQLGWLPSYGNATVWHYIMPIITMATSEAAIFSRYARSAMIDALRLPCVRAARMRGLPERRIIWLHALPNAMLSILTILGFFLGTLVAGAVITENVFFTAGLLAPVLAPYDLEAMDLTARLLMPFESAAHILGTDELGRDIFSRLLYSIRMSFVLAVVGTLLGAVIGTLLGFLAARFGGIVDDAVNCGIDFTASLPFIILALTIIAFLGTDVTVIIVIMAVYGWDRYARLTRNLSRSAYTEGYACALEGLGLPTVSIALRHILPNIASALVVNMTLNFPGMILLETSLSFLGVGVQPPMSSLGTMLGFGRDYLTTAWWIAVIPGLVIVVSTLSMSILGDWVQQKLEPAAR